MSSSSSAASSSSSSKSTTYSCTSFFKDQVIPAIAYSHWEELARLFKSTLADMVQLHGDYTFVGEKGDHYEVAGSTDVLQYYNERMSCNLRCNKTRRLRCYRDEVDRNTMQVTCRYRVTNTHNFDERKGEEIFTLRHLKVGEKGERRWLITEITSRILNLEDCPDVDEDDHDLGPDFFACGCKKDVPPGGIKLCPHPLKDPRKDLAWRRFFDNSRNYRDDYGYYRQSRAKAPSYSYIR